MDKSSENLSLDQLLARPESPPSNLRHSLIQALIASWHIVARTRTSLRLLLHTLSIHGLRTRVSCTTCFSPLTLWCVLPKILERQRGNTKRQHLRYFSRATASFWLVRDCRSFLQTRLLTQSHQERVDAVGFVINQ